MTSRTSSVCGSAQCRSSRSRSSGLASELDERLDAFSEHPLRRGPDESAAQPLRVVGLDERGELGQPHRRDAVERRPHGLRVVASGTG